MSKRLTIQPQIQMPIRLRDVRKMDMRSQFGALVYRIRNDKVQILLITSRGTGRWIIPKGWPVTGATPAEAAATEAWEEAGITGRINAQNLGVYSYYKRRESLRDLPCLVMVYPLEARKIHTKFPERTERRRKWFSPKKAAQLVHEAELAQMILRFDPRNLR